MVQTDTKKVIRTQKIFMILTGVWPARNAPILYKIYQKVLMFLCVLEIIGLCVQCLYASSNLKLFSAALSIFIAPFCGLLKNFAIVYKIKTLREAFDILERPIFKKYPNCLDYRMAESSFRSKRTSILFLISVSFSAGMYGVKSIATADYLIPFMYDLIEFGKWTMCFQLLENIVLFYIAYKDLAVDLLVVGFLLIAVGHFNILHDKIVNVKKWAGLSIDEINSGKCQPYVEDIKPEDDEKINEALGECIEYHCSLLDCLKKMEETFTWISLGQFLNSVIVCCNTGFMMVNTDIKSVLFVAMVAYFSCMMFELSLYCWFGNELMLESAKIINACYHSDWINCGPKVRKSLFILMERAKRPSYLTGAKFANLSLQTFTSILRLTYSYFALMQQLYKNSK